jgi:hypothetical protein
MSTHALIEFCDQDSKGKIRVGARVYRHYDGGSACIDDLALFVMQYMAYAAKNNNRYIIDSTNERIGQTFAFWANYYLPLLHSLIKGHATRSFFGDYNHHLILNSQRPYVQYVWRVVSKYEPSPLDPASSHVVALKSVEITAYMIDNKRRVLDRDLTKRIKEALIANRLAEELSGEEEMQPVIHYDIFKGITVSQET